MKKSKIEKSKMDAFAISINSLIKDVENGQEIDIEAFKNSMEEISLIDVPYSKYLIESSMKFLEYIIFLKKGTFNKKNTKKLVIDCFTFYNELEILELRLSELYDVVDKFILVEAEKTHKGEDKGFIFEENKERFEKWMNKIIHVKVYYPSNINDAWGREKFQRNSFMPTLYSLGLSDKDVIFITDVDEILDYDRVKYIKESYDLDGIYKMEMVTYFGSIYNLETSVKWYHPKVMNWSFLKSSTPDECRLNFNCQWWELGGWHLTYFGGPDRIANKLEHFAHQEYNKESFKNIDYIDEAIVNGKDLFGEWRRIKKINPEDNNYLPKNWRILLPLEEKYKTKDGSKKTNI